MEMNTVFYISSVEIVRCDTPLLLGVFCRSLRCSDGRCPNWTSNPFFQTGQAARDVYVILPWEIDDLGNSLWLLLTAAYGLVNSNSKFQAQSDDMLLDLGFGKFPLVPQLFFIMDNSRFIVILSKLVDDLLLSGISFLTYTFPKHINDLFRLELSQTDLVLFTTSASTKLSLMLFPSPLMATINFQPWNKFHFHYIHDAN